jgi:hypothetical protein
MAATAIKRTDEAALAILDCLAPKAALRHSCRKLWYA